MIALFALCFVFAEPVLAPMKMLESCEEARFTYWEFTPNDTVTYWEIAFNEDEIRSLAPLLTRARIDERGEGMFIASYDGALKTQNGEYHIRIGLVKNSEQPVLFRLKRKQPVDAPDEFYILEGEDAQKFWRVFEGSMARRARTVEPARVRRRE